MPKPKPLLFRIINSLALGPWRALGLLDDMNRVELPLFDSFRNPTPPPGGWASLQGYRRFVQRQQQLMQSWDEFGSDAGFKAAAAQQGLVVDDDEGLGRVPGPRALWLRVTLSGRSYEAGPPRVYSASAKLDVDRGGCLGLSLQASVCLKDCVDWISRVGYPCSMLIVAVA
jgi:hypothetical protein